MNDLIPKEKWYKDRVTIVIILSFLALLASNITLAIVYCYHGHLNTKNDISADYIGAFGSFIGGVTGSFLNLAAIYLLFKTYKSQKEELSTIKRIHEQESKLNHQPHLIINDFNVSFIIRGKSNITSMRFQNQFIDSNDQGGLTETGNSVQFELINIGNGSAKEILVLFILNFDEIENYYNSATLTEGILASEDIIERIKTNITLIKNENESILQNNGYYILEEKIKYLMPTSENNISKQLQYPTDFLKLISYSFYCRNTTTTFPKPYIAVIFETKMNDTLVYVYKTNFNLLLEKYPNQVYPYYQTWFMFKCFFD